PSYCYPSKSMEQQINEGIEFHKTRYKNTDKFLAYFQAYSNTYAPLDQLIKIYEQALKNPKIIGLVIGTRPDCMDDEKLDYFEQLSEKIYLVIEYGIESCYNHTLEYINRGHSFELSKKMIKKTARRGIRIGGHLIFGLPGESITDMLKEAELISKLPLNMVKFHQLQIVKNTVLAREYENNPEKFQLFSLQDYLEFLVRFIENLNPEFVIERFAGEVPLQFLISPSWGKIRNDQVSKLFEQKLEEYNTWQGKNYKTKEKKKKKPKKEKRKKKK
ncbi:TIGR01212 family radical SAM protein, partial [Bacteroidota bacterium]